MNRFVLLAICAILLAPPATLRAEERNNAMSNSPNVARQSGYLEIKGINYYYEQTGKGEPLLLLHGGLGSIDMFRPILPILTAHRQVVAVDLQGHGRTTLGDRPISMIDMGDDMAVLLDKLGYKQVDVLGYSMGAGVALRLAVQHPAVVRRLVLVSTGFAQDGFYPEMLPQQAQVGAAMADQMKETPMYKSYMAVAPHPEDFPKLLDGMGAWMRTPYNWADEVKRLQMPVMLIYGDSDMFRPEHMVEFYHLLGGWPEGRRLAAREHVEEPARGPARPHALRDFRRCRHAECRAALPRRHRQCEELGGSVGPEELAS